MISTTATKLLERGKFIASSREKPERMDLLIEAGAVLGYKPHALSQDQAILDRMQGECEIEAVLGRLSLRPFATSTVEHYKSAMVRKTERAGSNAFVLKMHESKGGDIVFGFGLGSAFLTFAAVVGVASGFGWLEDHHQPADFHHLGWIRLSIIVLAAVCLTCFAISMYARYKFAFRREAAWRRVSLDSYTKPIPDFAVETALSLVKELPTARFCVDELTAEDRGVRFHRSNIVHNLIDPFLVMTYKGYELYVEVWNEHKFEGKRIK